MRAIAVGVLALTSSLVLRADFSYTSTTKNAGGMMASAAPQVTRNFFKGDKMKIDQGVSATILDFGAKTVTHINHAQKSYSVVPFGDVAGMAQQMDADVQVDVKETGQRKVINGFNCHEAIVTMVTSSGRPGSQMKMNMTITMDMWLSPDVPGYPEMRAFYQRIASGPGWASIFGGSAQGMGKAMASMQQKLATLNGVPVVQTMKMGMGGDAAQNAQMQAARAQLEALKAKGGEQAKMADAALARMGGGAGGSMMEMTIESSGFSTAAIPASEFAPPAGYAKK